MSIFNTVWNAEINMLEFYISFHLYMVNVK